MSATKKSGFNLNPADEGAKEAPSPTTPDSKLRAEIESEYPEESHPIKYALSIAVRKKLQAIEELSLALAASAPKVDWRPLSELAPGPEKSLAEEFRGAFADLWKMVEELKEEQAEITKWIDIPPRTEDDRLQRNSKAVENLQEIHAPPADIVKLIQSLNAAKPGRPPTTRTIAVDALELWLVNPKKSWMQVTREVCNCGQNSHTRDCWEKLRQQINDLRTLLHKLGIKADRR